MLAPVSGSTLPLLLVYVMLAYVLLRRQCNCFSWGPRLSQSGGVEAADRWYRSKYRYRPVIIIILTRRK
jgi:hypothetical protein